MSKDAFDNKEFWSTLENLGSGSNLETKSVFSSDESSSNINLFIPTIARMSSLNTTSSSDEKNERFFQPGNSSSSVSTILQKKSKRQCLLFLNKAYPNALNKNNNFEPTPSKKRKENAKKKILQVQNDQKNQRHHFLLMTFFTRFLPSMKLSQAIIPMMNIPHQITIHPR